jgi:hypothetical protein
MAEGIMDGSKQALALAEVARQLDGAAIPWAVFAGAAAILYGATHPLSDVDILVPATDVDQVLALFPEAQVFPQAGGAPKILLPGYDLVPGLDLLDLDAPMVARLEHHLLQGVLVPVIPPEDNILLKAMWGRGAADGKHDWEDVEAMMAHRPKLDWDYLCWRADTFPDTDNRRQVLTHLTALRAERRADS